MITVNKHLAVMNDGFTINNYIVTDDETGATAVVDPSLPEESLIEELTGKDVQYILLTHGHFDHICGAKLVKEKTGAKVVIHKDDEIMLHDTEKNEFEISYNSKTYTYSSRMDFNNDNVVDVNDIRALQEYNAGNLDGGLNKAFIKNYGDLNGDKVINSYDVIYLQNKITIKSKQPYKNYRKK